MNLILEAHKKFDEWFEKVETLLDENYEVINTLLVSKINKEDDAPSNGSN